MDPAPETHLYFRPNSDLAPQDGQEFIKIVSKAEADLAAIDKKQTEIAISFDSRYLPLDKIEAGYNTFKGELQELAKKIKACKTLIKQQSEQLPLLANETLDAKWQSITDLELKCHRIKKNNRHLTTLVQSPQYRQALIFYKKTIQECEQSNISSHRLEELIEETKRQIKSQTSSIEFLDDQNLRDSIQLLHQEMFRFLRYAATTISDSFEKIRIEKLITPEQPLEEMMQKLSMTVSSDATFQLTAWGSEKLEADRYFKKGIYCADWRYPTIYQIITPLQEAAKTLQGLEKDLEIQVTKAWQGTFRPQKTLDLSSEIALYNELLAILTQKIKDEEQKLYQIPFSTEVHSGLHYVASLFTWIEKIRHTLSFFEKITDISWTKISKIQPSLYNSFQQPLPCTESAPFQSLSAINCLFETIHFLHVASPEDSSLTDPFLKKSKIRILTRANESVARIGMALFPFSRREQILLDCIPSQSSFEYLYEPDFTSDHGIEAGIKSLISKRIIQHFHFTKNPFDLSLDIFLTAISAEKIFQRFYQIITSYHSDRSSDTIDHNANLQKLIIEYETKTSLTEDREMVLKLTRVAQLLYQMTNDSIDGKEARAFSQYTECQQELFKARKKATTSHAIARLTLFIDENKSTFSKIKSQYKFPDYCDVFNVNILATQEVSDEVMYQWLTTAIWGEQKREIATAQTQIEKSITDPNCNFLSKNITYLLKFLALRVYDRTSNELAMPQTICRYLPLLLAEYVVSPESYFQFHPVYVELALYSALKVPSIKENRLLETALQQHRGTPFLNLWGQAMIYFLNCEKEKTEQSILACKGIYQAIKQHHSEALTPYYENILNRFLKSIDPDWKPS